MLGAAVRRCSVAAAAVARTSPRGLLHSTPAPGSAAGEVCYQYEMKRFYAIKSQKGLRFLDEAIQGQVKELWRGYLRGLKFAVAIQSIRCYSHGSHETDEEFDARWVTYFNRPDIDAWELRKGMNTLVGYDLVPEPKIIDAALRACRRLNDFASAVRILEVVKDKAGPHKEIYPYVIQELRPTLNELGISTPEELGLDKV
nr:cytochrome c oxidase subunit 5A, mitochondrial isoform X1 [Globicephala melas]